MQYPDYRPRRLRRSENLRRLVRETTLAVDNFIYPIFVCPGRGERRPISSLPGQAQVSVDEAVAEAEECAALGIPGVILFGAPDDARKDAVGSEAWNDQGLVQQATRAIKRARPELVVMLDACFDEYTTHGHCGVVMPEGGWTDVDNEATLENLARVAVSQAKCGADFVAPSGMMDGFVTVTREALDEAGYEHVGVMAYSAKYASCFYGPFRQAAGTASGFGDRKSYQMDPSNSQEAIREVTLDVAEREFLAKKSEGGQSAARDMEDLTYRFYRDTWDKLPDFDGLKVEETGKLPGGPYVASSPERHKIVSSRGPTPDRFARTASRAGVYPPVAKADYLKDWKKSIQSIIQGQKGPVKINGKDYNSEMENFGTLSDQEVADVMNFMYNNWGNKGKYITPEEVKSLRK